jgi:hypothetical protein
MFAYKPKGGSLDLVVRVFVDQSVKMNRKISLALHILSESGVVGRYQLFRGMCPDMKSQMFVTLYRTGLNEVLRYDVEKET